MHWHADAFLLLPAAGDEAQLVMQYTFVLTLSWREGCSQLGIHNNLKTQAIKLLLGGSCFQQDASHVPAASKNSCQKSEHANVRGNVYCEMQAGTVTGQVLHFG